MPMIQFVNNYQDLSTDKSIQFKFYCDKCDNGYLSKYQTSTLGMARSLPDSASNLPGWGYSAGNSTSKIVECGKLETEIDDGKLQISGNEFKIAFLIDEIPATSTPHTTVKHFGWCGENQDHDSTEESSMSFSVQGITIGGTIDPKNPNQIEGSESYTDEMGNEVTIRWSLRNYR